MGVDNRVVFIVYPVIMPFCRGGLSSVTWYTHCPGTWYTHISLLNVDSKSLSGDDNSVINIDFCNAELPVDYC